MDAPISRLEWRRVLLFGLALMLLTSAPYLMAWARAGDNWLFNGFAFGVEDGNAYLGKMRIGARGEWAFYLFYSPETHDSVFGLYLPHILIGQVVGLFIAPDDPKLSQALIIAFHVWRVMAGLILIAASYRFIAFFIRSPQTRWLILLLVTLGGGLGWLLILGGQTDFLGTLPIDFYIPEAFSFLILYSLPHVALGRAALLLGFICLAQALIKRDPRYAIGAGLLWNVVGLMVTFYLALIYVLLAAWGVALILRWWRFPWDYIRLGLLASALTLPLFLYSAWAFNASDVFAQWSRQNDLPSPHPLHYVLGYGLWVILAFTGGRWAWRKAAQPEQAAYALLPAWLLIVPILVYLPINVQRRLAEAVILPLGILAVVGLKLAIGKLQIFGKTRLSRYKRLRRLILVALLPSSALFLLITTFGLLNPSCSNDVCAYRPRAELDALNWLNDYAERDSIVLGNVATGNFLPVQTDLRPLLGHGPETVYFAEKEPLMRAFYKGEMTSEERAAFLDRYQIRYVFFGPLEKAINSDAGGWNSDLDLIYNQADYAIYEVSNSQ